MGNREWQPSAGRPRRRDGTGAWRVVDRPERGALRVWRGQGDRSSPRHAADRYDTTTTGSFPPVSPGYADHYADDLTGTGFPDPGWPAVDRVGPAPGSPAVASPGVTASADVGTAPYRYPRAHDRDAPPSDGDEERYPPAGRLPAPPAQGGPATHAAPYSGRRIGWPGTGEIPKYREYPTGRHAAVEEPERQTPESSDWPGAATTSAWSTVPSRRSAARTAPAGRAAPARAAAPAAPLTRTTRTRRVAATGRAAVRLPTRATASPVPAGRAPATARAAGREAPEAAGRPGDLDPDLVEPDVPWPPVLAWTIALFAVPMLAYLLWAWTRSGTPAAGCVDVADGACVAPRTAALTRFTTAFPSVVAALALSAAASAGLRLLNYAWRPVTIALGGAVIGAGLTTVVVSALG